MSRFWTRFWWLFVFLGTLAMVVFWIIPEPQREGDPTPEERMEIADEVRRAQEDLPYLRLDKIRAHRKKVIEVNATWIGKDPPPISDRKAWSEEADRVAVLVAEKHLPPGWQVNVALWYRRLPRGMAGRESGPDRKGGPAHVFRNKRA